MNYLRTIVVSLVSALVGGLIVSGIFAWKLTLFPTISKADVKKEFKSYNPPYSEKELFETMNEYQKNMLSQFDSYFNDDFFSQDDPFEAMRKFRKDMDEDLQKFSSRPFSSPFDSWFDQKFGGGTVEDVKKREDDNFIYYDIKVKDVNGTTVNTNIENGYLTITGKIESRNLKEDAGSQISNKSVFSSSFSRTFPLPANVDENTMQMESEDNKIVIKFPKKKSR